MSYGHHKKPRGGSTTADPSAGATAPGKSSAVTSRYAGVQRKASGAEAATPGAIAEAAVHDKDAGSPVEQSVRARAEGQVGADLSNVRVHRDERANQSAAAIGARAFTYGSDVFLGPDESPGDVKLMAHELTHVVQQGAATQREAQAELEVGAAGTPAEREADAIGERAASGQPPAQMIVDGAAMPADGQMSKAEFLAELRAQVTATADIELGPAWSAIGCPYIDQWFARHQGSNAATLDMLAKRYSGVANPRNARDYIAPICRRVREGISKWQANGELDGELAAAGISAGSAPSPEEAAGVQLARDPDAALPAVRAEPEAMAAPAPGSPADLVARMGDAEPIDAAAGARIGGAMGADLSSVKVHTSPQAQRLASEQDAAALAVGDHIAFGAGSYAPGTIEGDALLAHEAAHVVQQRPAGPATAQRATVASAEGSALEADADQAATGVLGRLYGGVTGAMRTIGDRVAPALTSGFSLQRCGKNEAESKKAELPAKPSPQGTPTAKGESSERFTGDPALTEIVNGKSTVDPGAKGHHVRKIQQALVDTGLLPADAVNGEMDAKTVAAIKALQKKAKLPETGKVDNATMAALTKGFDEFKAYRDLADAGRTDAEKLAGTRSLDDEDRAAIERAMNPAADKYVPVPDGKGGTTYVPPTFNAKVGGKDYAVELEKILEANALNQWERMAKGKDDAARKDSNNLHDWATYDDVGVVAKRETDVVFGDYNQGPAIKHGEKPDKPNKGEVLFDRYDDQDNKIGKMSDAQKDQIAQWRIQKLLNANGAVEALRDRHGALQDREKGIEEPIRDRVAKKHRDKMLELHKNWPGSQSEGKIFLQRWKHTGPGADEANRKQMWGIFQTCIHEYLHLLTHTEFSKYANSHPDGHSLREGMTDLFTKIVWSNVPIEAVRKDVEGPFFKAGGAVPNKGRYSATAQAEQVVSITGAKNAYAAYFLGKVELIGKK